MKRKNLLSHRAKLIPFTTESVKNENQKVNYN